jgi:hypothetical protein
MDKSSFTRYVRPNYSLNKTAFEHKNIPEDLSMYEGDDISLRKKTDIERERTGVYPRNY